MSTDTTFFTNEPGATLLDRFKKTLQTTQYFDVLVGYFRTSGFHRLYDAFEEIEKIRILVGLGVDRETIEIIETVRSNDQFDFESHTNTKRLFSQRTVAEMDDSEDSYDVELGIRKFIEFLTSDCANKDEDIAHGGNGKKLELRVYPSEKIHAKVYISRYHPEDRDFGSVITGSSNFSESGLIANREFNVELKNSADVEFALNQFENLWKDAVDVSKEYVDTIHRQTWLSEDISPYHLYLKMLYEYLKEDINLDQEIEFDLPGGFLNLEYQRHAVVSSKKILEAYNGVFLADVVGLGKTYISALLARQLSGKKLVICPPVLQEYWYDTFAEFGVTKFKVESLGKLDHILQDGADKFDYVFIDEAHRFRNEYTQGFEKIHEICFGKKVILVSATPLNNTLDDIYSQLKLFQIPRRSTIPGVPDLDGFFQRWREELRKYSKSDPEYAVLMKQGAEEVREKVLKYVMVRRTRTEIKNYFSKDIEQRGLSFPTMGDPNRIVYRFPKDVDDTFNRTIGLLKEFHYSRYTPLLYLKHEVSPLEQQSQKNVGGFMKGILVKRLESSFYAFRRTLDRFITSYERFIEMLASGTVLIGKKVNVYDLLDEDDADNMQQLVEKGDLKKYSSDEFSPELAESLAADLQLLKEIRKLWTKVDSDPKLEKFMAELQTNPNLKDHHLVIFTESKETGEYLFNNINQRFPGQVLFYSSQGGKYIGEDKSVPVARRLIKESFDPNYHTRNDKIRILISTDVLAEGINLHRSNTVINYDLPWNPTKVLQRVGRVNRVGTKHQEIQVFNFFPTDQSEQEIGLEANIKAKIQAFHDTLGEDAKYLTEEEVVSTHELFGDTLYKRLTSKETYEGKEEQEPQSELKYLKLIRDIRDNEPDLFEKIKRLPKKARSGRAVDGKGERLITFFRKGKLKKFFVAGEKRSRELPFLEAVNLFECDSLTPRSKISSTYYSLLDKNKAQFDLIVSGGELEPGPARSSRSSEGYVIRRLKTKEFRYYQGFTDEDEEYIRLVLSAYEDGIIPANTTKRIKKAIEREPNPLKVLAILKRTIPDNLLGLKRRGQSFERTRREVILSEYLTGGGSE
jgi:SNF2 family DNA or RNA helicase